MGKFIDLTGRRFGRLVVIEKSNKNKFGKWMWLCKCDCGNYKEVGGRELVRERGTKTCNNCPKDYSSYSCYKHGMTGTRLYQCYKLMKNRCYNAHNKRYYLYGDRGIKVCDEWLGENGASNFIKWALDNGYNDQLTLDRIDNNKGYSPQNCRWATRKQQSNNLRNNLRFDINGEIHTLPEISEIYNIDYKLLYSRIRNGWDIHKAISKK